MTSIRRARVIFLSIAVFALVVSAAVSAVAEQWPRGLTGTAAKPPSDAPTFEETQLVLVAEPEVAVKGNAVEVRFRTARSAPAARVFFGTFEPDQKLVTPRYRTAAREDVEGFTTDHVVKFDLAKLKQPLYDLTGMAARDEGLVPYRIEVYDAKWGGSVFYDRVFAFRKGRRVAAVSEGPFVDLVTHDSAVISWSTDFPVDGEVLADGRVFAGGKGERFEVRLTGLPVDSEIEYRLRIHDGNGASETRAYAFRTPPKNPTHFTFAVFGDSREGWGGGERSFNGTNYRTLTRFFYESVEKGAAFIVHSGDLINGYTTSSLDFRMQLSAFKDAEGVVGHRVPIYEVMGNHEVVMNAWNVEGAGPVFMDKTGADAAEVVFAESFVNPRNGPAPTVEGAPPYAENVYTIDHGNARIVVMNNNYWWSSHAERFGGNLEGYVMDDQFAWLAKAFEDAKNDPNIEHLFLVAQEAMFPNGGHTEDGMWYSGGAPEKNGGVDRRYVSARRDEIWKAFTDTGKARAANFGDEHNYNRTWIGPEYDRRLTRGAWQIISGGAGAPYYNRDASVPWAPFVKVFSTQMNYTIFRVDGPRVEMTAYGYTGEVIDHVVLAE